MGPERYTADFGNYQDRVIKALHQLKDIHVISRIWEKDHTVWNPAPTEIDNRLGWLDCPENMNANIDEINSFSDDVRNAGYTHAILLGMGGSSLAPEVFSRVFGGRKGFLSLTVLDSTHPDAVREVERSIVPGKTLFIVSTKSGGTVETLSFMKYFYNLNMENSGADKAGESFIAITDPGSSLEKAAGELNFRKIFLNDPNIGGRYAALSHFGLVPAALVGVDLGKLLDQAVEMAGLCSADDDNPAALLGVAMGELANAGRDKVTLVLTPEIAPFGAWAEQLIAESTGKDGKGILPVDGEEVLSPEYYSNDRLFVYMKLGKGAAYDGKIKSIKEAGHPVVEIGLDDIYDLGGEYFRWELAVAIAGWRIGIHPFNQPNVESAKVLAREMVSSYIKEGKLPETKPDLVDGPISVFGNVSATEAPGALDDFLNNVEHKANEDSYVAIQAYLRPSVETSRILLELRTSIQKKYKVATTFGYGPRFLHSTGQLHKGDGGNGLFIIFTDNPSGHPEIPNEAGKAGSQIDFGTLIAAQSMGDRKALLDNGREVIRFHLGSDIAGGIRRLISALG